MRTIALVNQKGGCGKTTVSINLASALAEAGHKTLLVDIDPQSHCAVGLAVPEEQIEQSIYDVLISKSRNEPMKLTEILWQISDKLELAPASIDLSAFEQQMSGISLRECCLKDVLSAVQKEYDYAIIDCPPAVGLLTFNALRAATDVIVPVETGYFALHGLSKQLETLSILCERCNHQVNVRVLASMYDIRTKIAREILAELRNHFADKMFKTIVNFNTKLKEAASFGQPISEYDSACRGRRDFHQLASEIITSELKFAEGSRREMVSSLSSQLESISTTAEELLQSVGAAPDDAQVKHATLETQPSTQQARGARLPDGQGDIMKKTEFLTGPVVEPAKAEEPKLALASDKQGPTEAKLSNYYGVNQINDAIVFVTLYPRAKSVHIAADFNNWQPEKTPLEKVAGTGIWQTKLNLPVGKYRYRLVVDGQWQQDPYNEKTESNPFGDFNSVVEVE